ncbi:MAG: hypothetical protein ACO38N_12480 [Candidatus Nanopelagicales bacterium]
MAVAERGLASARKAAPSWAERITGRWAISWQVIVIGTLLTYPQIVLTGGTLGSREVQPEQFPTMAWVTAVAAACAVSYAVIADYTFFRHRRTRPVPLWLYVGFYLSAGFIYAAGMEVADDILGVETIIPLWVRFLFAGITTVVFGVVMSLLLEARDRFRRERATLLEQEVAVAADLLREQGIIDGLSKTLHGEVDESLRRARERILAVASAEQAATQQSWHEVAEEVGAAARDSVRPLSHALWEQAELEYPKPRLGGVVRQFLAAPRFLPAATAVLVGVGLPGAAIRAVGPAWAPLLIAVAVAAVYGVLRVADRFLVQWSPWRLAWFLAGYLATLAIVLAVAFLPGPGSGAAGEVGAIVIGVTTAIVITSMVGALDDVRAKALASLQTGVAQGHIQQDAQRREVAVTLSNLAQHLHGSVQTRLTMCAAGVERAASDGDVAAYQECVGQALTVLGEAALPGEWSGNVAEDLGRLRSQWAGLCDVEYRIDPTVGAGTGGSTTPKPEVAVVVAEAVSNAYRHGGATRLDVSVDRMADGIRIAARDDGHGPHEVTPGLGMATLNRLSRGRVELRGVPEGGLLVVDLPDRD